MKRNKTLFLILLTALAHGLIYVFLMPPWQHYDEPNHFEYIWLLAKELRLPAPDDFNPQLSQQVVASMMEHDFYRYGLQPDNLEKVLAQGRIPGFSELEEPPLYYMLAAVPVRLLLNTSVEIQLIAARLVSLCLFLVTIALAFAVSWELFEVRDPLQWLFPLTLVLLPAFVDLMTAVNNDVGAIAVSSLVVYGSVRFVQRGYRWRDLILTGLAALMALFTKNTAAVSAIILPFMLVFAILRGRLRKIGWAIIGLGGIGTLALTLSWGDASAWYRGTSQKVSTRLSDAKAVHGEFVFTLDAQAKVVPSWQPAIYQPLPIPFSSTLKGKSFTLGFWMWSSQPMETRSPLLRTRSQEFWMPLQVDPTPRFFAFHAENLDGTYQVWVDLDPYASDEPIELHYDSLVLAEGLRPLDTPPEFISQDGMTGEWGGRPFTNLLRNPSAEQGGLRVNPLVDNLATRFLPNNTRPSTFLVSLIDWPGAGHLQRVVTSHTFRTFWAVFGWGQVRLWGGTPYRYLLIFTLLGLLGALLKGILNWRQIPFELAFLTGLILLVSWGMTITRAAAYLSLPYYYWTPARHAYPVIIPTMMVLSVGWGELFELSRRLWQRMRKGIPWLTRLELLDKLILEKVYGYFLILAIFLYLDVRAVLSIIKYYGL